MTSSLPLLTDDELATAGEAGVGAITTERGNLPLEAIDVDATLTGLVARVALTQTFGNRFDQPLEASYIFPLPDRAAVTEFRMEVGERVGSGTEPDTDAVPDASRITPPVLLPGFPNPVDLSIRVKIDPAGLELGAVRSSLHTVVEEERDGIRTVRAEPGERANRDFVLRLQTGSSAVSTALTAAEDAEGGRGTFALTLLPPVGADVVPPRDLVFVLDRSGSMGGWKMVAARRAVARMVDSLTGRDRFGLLAFDNLVETPPELGGSGGLELSPPENRGSGLRVAGDHAR